MDISNSQNKNGDFGLIVSLWLFSCTLHLLYKMFIYQEYEIKILLLVIIIKSLTLHNMQAISDFASRQL